MAIAVAKAATDAVVGSTVRPFRLGHKQVFL